MTPSKFPKFDIWVLAPIFIAAFVLLPVFCVFYLALFPDQNIWPHLLNTVLPHYLTNSLIMMGGVGTWALLIGVPTAWLVAHYDFTARNILQWALFLPLAIPTYIGAYAFVDFWEYAGPAQTLLRDTFGWQNPQDYSQWFIPVRSQLSAIFVLGFGLYPYVYMLARAAFVEQSANAVESARCLGIGAWGCFFRVSLPLAWPAIVIALALVAMETLGEFGAMEFFAVQTLTTGIFTVWLEGSNIGGAAQIASIIFALIMALVLIERISRRRVQVFSNAVRPIARYRLTGMANIMATGFCAIVVFLGFILPFGIIANYALQRGDWGSARLWIAAFTSIWTAVVAVIAIVCLALILIFALRLSRSVLPRLLAPISTIGYAAPGAILGLGILIAFAWFDHAVADVVFWLFGLDIGLLLTGSAAGVICAYVIRFFALASGGLDAGFGRIAPSLGLVARSLGATPGRVLRRVHMPMMRTTILSISALIFVDCIKELPATLLLRPFGYHNLATHVYDFASLEDIRGASVGAVLIILTSIGAVALLARSWRG
ncbi:MAG: ABC transporter permease [Candidatus Halichondribacter symbioticus]